MPEQLSDHFCGPPDAPDRYLLRERRSSGGEGEIWSAVEQHANFSFRYAVKIIHADHQDDSGRWLENLRLQSALLTQLEHPSLVKVREVFVGAPPHPHGAPDAAAGSRLYLVMKWIEGRSLQELLEAGELRGPAALDPLAPVAEAIDYLHSGRDTDGQPVLHRDIKPANILRADDGRVYLVDFGLVRFAGAATMSKVSGTVPFMAPESLHRGEYGPASDRYSLGASLYYMLTRELPVPGDTDAMQQRLAAALGAGQDRMVQGILSMMAVSPTHRPASAQQWLHALRTPVAETTLGAPAPPVPPPTPAPPRITAETVFGGATSSPPRSAPPNPSAAPVPPSVPGPVPPSVTGVPTSLGAPAASRMPPPGYRPAPPRGAPPPPVAPFPGTAQPWQPAKKRKLSGGKIAAIVAGSVGLVVVASCVGLGILGYREGQRDSGSGGHNPDASASVDHKHPPPTAARLKRIQVSVGQIEQATGAESYGIEASESKDRLLGGLDQFKPCAEGTVDGAAIGSQTSNGFSYYTDDETAYASSSVVGFYGTASSKFYTAAKQSLQRCGWNTFEIGKIGQQSVGYTRHLDDGEYGPTTLVLVRSGQVVFELTLTAKSGGAQVQAEQLATAMAKYLPEEK
ncbi:serine/threonine protein kinase [Actinocatenispora sera]|nr:serine/threonine-protein kinase [Actinocatenispora sera]